MYSIKVFKIRFMKFNLYFLFIFLVFSTICFGQYGIKKNSEEALESYTLFETTNTTYLIDNCGEIVNEWGVSRTDLHSKLLPNGNLLYIKDNLVYEVDWNDNVVLITDHGQPTLDLTYEVIVLPNGNYLCVARRIRTSEFFTTLGYNPALGFPGLDDSVVEMVPETGQIVWEWNISDHIIQDRNNTIANYGILSENPQLLSVDAISTFDWEFNESFMINGMDYNADLDQIVLSIRKISEIVIIDHSTTTAQAKESAGGRYGKGGDILYRWGNPQNYGQGSSADRILYYQHNPNWIEYGEYEGMLIMHNNGLDRPGTSFNNRYSSAEIIEPVSDGNGNYTLVGGVQFFPNRADKSYNRFTTGTEWYSGYTSSTKVLPNGNIYITEGANDRYLEINPAGEVVWEYENQFGTYIFRSEKYSTSYAAFDNKVLQPNSTVEQPSSTYNCTIFTTSIEDIQEASLNINVQFDGENILVNSGNEFQFSLMVYDMLGQNVAVDLKNKTKFTIPTENLNSGIYIVTAMSKEHNVITSHKVFVP